MEEQDMKRTAPEISIIVPVYKTELYLRRCVDSILAQTFRDFELILVDDGSPDGCPAICDDYAAQDPRVVVIHQENGGVSKARNTGLDRAQGKYIMFCDSDDIVSKRWCEHLYTRSIENDRYMPVCAYTGCAEEVGSERQLPIVADIRIAPQEYYRLNQAGIAGYIWNAIFIHSVLETKKICFREKKEKGDYNEDLLFTMQYIKNMQGIIYCGYADYGYLTREDSLSRGAAAPYLEKYLEKYMLWKDFLCYYGQAQKSDDLASTTLYHIIHALSREVAENRWMTPFFWQTVQRDLVTDILHEAVNHREDPRILRYIEGKQALRLWIRLKLGSLKAKRTKER